MHITDRITIRGIVTPNNTLQVHAWWRTRIIFNTEFTDLWQNSKNGEIGQEENKVYKDWEKLKILKPERGNRVLSAACVKLSKRSHRNITEVTTGVQPCTSRSHSSESHSWRKVVLQTCTATADIQSAATKLCTDRSKAYSVNWATNAFIMPIENTTSRIGCRVPMAIATAIASVMDCRSAFRKGFSPSLWGEPLPRSPQSNRASTNLQLQHLAGCVQRRFPFWLISTSPVQPWGFHPLLTTIKVLNVETQDRQETEIE